MPTTLPALARLTLVAVMTLAACQGRRLFDYATDSPTPTDRLFAAATANDPAALHDALRAGASPRDTDSHHATALMYAARAADTPLLLLLLNTGADPNATDSDGLTPLMYAAWSNRPDNVRLLLSHGADPTPRESHGHTARTLAELAECPPTLLRLFPDPETVH